MVLCGGRSPRARWRSPWRGCRAPPHSLPHLPLCAYSGWIHGGIPPEADHRQLRRLPRGRHVRFLLHVPLPPRLQDDARRDRRRPVPADMLVVPRARRRHEQLSVPRARPAARNATCTTLLTTRTRSRQPRPSSLTLGRPRPVRRLPRRATARASALPRRATARTTTASTRRRPPARTVTTGRSPGAQVSHDGVDCEELPRGHEPASAAGGVQRRVMPPRPSAPPDCSTCHAGTIHDTTPEVGSCTSCHAGYQKHAGAGCQCTSCHTNSAGLPSRDGGAGGQGLPQLSRHETRRREGAAQHCADCHRGKAPAAKPRAQHSSSR